VQRKLLKAGKGLSKTMETYKRAVGEAVSQGYRQLPSLGNTHGPELKTIVFAGVGIVMGILVGTFVADGTLRIPERFSLQPVVHAVASKDVEVTHPVAKAGQNAAAVARNTPAPPPAATAQIQQAAGQREAAPGTTTEAHVQLAVRAVPTVPVLLTAAVTRASISSNPSPLGTVPSVHNATGLNRVSASEHAVSLQRHRTGRRLAAWRRHLSRRALIRRRVELSPGAEIADLSPSSHAWLALAAPDTKSAFTVEGQVSVASYNSSEGVIDSYEGETFALDKTLTASNALSGDDIPSSLHYRCDQFQNCSVILDGQSMSNVRRTR
jgi:hypothetical protein